MGKFFILIICSFIFQNLCGQIGKVGINTISPAAMLHVKDSSVVFTGSPALPATPGNTPVSGQGIRMMWYPDKAAFRAGRVIGNQWDVANIGNYSLAACGNTIASGNYSSALGNFTVASGLHSTAIGAFNVASGTNSFALGDNSEASGVSSLSMGFLCNSVGNYSAAMGYRVVSNSYLSFVIGRYNDLSSNSSTSWISSDPLFIIGNGSSNSSRSNALTVLKNGRTGINTSAPVAPLHVLDGSVVFNSSQPIPPVYLDPPVSGAGSRMMWYQNKVAFRAGSVSGAQWNADSIGTYSIALGQDVLAKGLNSLACGKGTRATGELSSAFGKLTTASGYGAIAAGEESTASGPNSTALSSYTKARGGSTLSAGFLTIANGFAGTVVGMYNDSIVAPQSFATSETPLFIIGNGSHSVRSNAMTVLKNGNTGIATSSPAFRLDIQGRMRIRNSSDGTPGIWFNNSDNSSAVSFIGMYNDSYIGIYSGLGAAWNFLMNLTNGFVGIGVAPSQKLHVSGNGLFTGTVTANCGLLVCSDERYKTNIRPLTNSLASVMLLNGIQYDWKKELFPEKQFNDKKQLGFSAQELEKIYPEMVHSDPEGYKTVDYSRLTPVLVEAIKEQQQIIQGHVDQLEGQQKQIDFLTRELMQLKSLISASLKMDNKQ